MQQYRQHGEQHQQQQPHLGDRIDSIVSIGSDATVFEQCRWLQLSGFIGRLLIGGLIIVQQQQ